MQEATSKQFIYRRSLPFVVWGLLCSVGAVIAKGSHIHIHEPHSSEGEKATGEKGPATALKLGTYALSQIFSHASHGDQLRCLIPHRSMYWSQVCHYPATLKTSALRLVLCAV